MPKRATKKPASVFRLHVRLEDVEPPVSRKLLVPSNITLADLHAAVNEVIYEQVRALGLEYFKRIPRSVA